MDRNLNDELHLDLNDKSPSSRRAWIEILLIIVSYEGMKVALLAEGVDRNKMMPDNKKLSLVALLAEGVDRNNLQPVDSAEKLCRPPRGGRG